MNAKNNKFTYGIRVAVVERNKYRKSTNNN